MLSLSKHEGSRWTEDPSSSSGKGVGGLGVDAKGEGPAMLLRSGSGGRADVGVEGKLPRASCRTCRSMGGQVDGGPFDKLRVRALAMEVRRWCGVATRA